MSTERFIQNVRVAITSLVATGCVSATSTTIKQFQALSVQSRNLGLTQLATEIDSLIQCIHQRGMLSFEPNVTLSNLVLGIFDRIEALASTLTLWSIEQQLTTTHLETTNHEDSEHIGAPK